MMKGMKTLVSTVLVLFLLLDCRAIGGRIARGGLDGEERWLLRHKRQATRRAGPPSKQINYASLRTGAVPPRVRNRLAGRPVSPSASASSSASSSDSSRGSTGGTSGYGSPTSFNPGANSYATGSDSNSYVGYGGSGLYSGQVGPQPIGRGKSTYPFANQEALNRYLEKQGRQQQYQSSYGGSSRNPYGGYQQSGGYSQRRFPQYGAYQPMYGAYPMPMNPYAGMYGQPMAPMTPYGYPPAGGYYYGGYHRGYQEPTGVSIGSPYRNSRPQSFPRPAYHSGSYGSSGSGSYGGSSGSGSYGGSSGSGSYGGSSGSGSYGGSSGSGSATSGYGSYTDSNSYGGSSPYGGGTSASYGTSQYGNGAGSPDSQGSAGSSPYGSAGSYGDTTGSFGNTQNTYAGTGGAYAGGSSATESDDSSYGGYGSYGTGQSGSLGSDSRTASSSYGTGYGSAGSYGGTDSTGYGYTSGSRYGISSQNAGAGQQGVSSYGDQSYGGDENPYSQTSGSRYGGPSSGNRYASSGSSYGGAEESESPTNPYSFGQYGGYGESATAGTGQAAAGSRSENFGRFFNPPSAGESDEYSRLFQKLASSGTSAPEAEEADSPYSPRGQYPPFVGTYTNSEPSEEEAEGKEVSAEEVAAEAVSAAVANPVSPAEPESESDAREITPREENNIFLIPHRQRERERHRDRVTEREDFWRIEAAEYARRRKKPKKFVHSSLDKCLAKPEGLPDLYLDHRKLQRSLFLDLKPLNELSCAMSENCLAPSAYTKYASQMRKLLRFATIAHNGGTGVFLPALPPEEWIYHTCHKHHHSMKVFAEYRLLNNSGHEVAKGHKASFCLEDSGCRNPCVRNYNCSSVSQGISPGCYDTYHASRDCQWIDVTDVVPEPDMKYTLQITVNPARAVPELDYTNNVIECSVRISVNSAAAHDCQIVEN